jgi:hypothetical protein
VEAQSLNSWINFRKFRTEPSRAYKVSKLWLWASSGEYKSYKYRQIIILAKCMYILNTWSCCTFRRALNTTHALTSACTMQPLGTSWDFLHSQIEMVESISFPKVLRLLVTRREQSSSVPEARVCGSTSNYFRCRAGSVCRGDKQQPSFLLLRIYHICKISWLGHGVYILAYTYIRILIIILVLPQLGEIRYCGYYMHRDKINRHFCVSVF